ncbi:hypothetical protein SCHPADRAFT_944648 [Schizopora paradoxa]|uniref:Uncharacterized protein n=1 Tax=Schizopora paradoxa TaxID=27342 RepID=A0A0H2RA22_9AGAM|nr:hypothetical protein SCHPADRAFT_944648 [Schizopora paradoxa]
MAARYLCHIFKAQLVGNDLYFLVKLWHDYLDFFVRVAGSKADWPTLDACIGNLPLGPLRTAFFPADRLFKLIECYFEVKKAILLPLPRLLWIFFSRPALVYKQTNALRKNSRSLTPFEQMPIEQERFNHLHRYLLHVLCRDSRSRLEVENILYAFVPYYDFGRGGDSAYRLWKYYYEVFKHVAINYSRGLVGRTHDFIVNTSAVREFFRISRSILDSKSETSDNKAFAAFLTESFSANDFYCEDVLKEEGGLEFFDYFDHSPSRCAEIRKISGTLSLPLFDNVPYLRRFRLGDKVHITSDHLPELPDVLVDNTCEDLCGLTIDTMTLSGDLVYWLLHEPGRGNEELQLDLEGHLPVQACDDSYVAAVKVEHIYYFTCVKNGASSVNYLDELGNGHSANKFFVLVLRHRDPTLAPIWREFWPKRDPLYCAKSDAARLDDDHLESCLVELQEFDRESELWKTIGF